jgi:hypothetical protein
MKTFGNSLPSPPVPARLYPAALRAGQPRRHDASSGGEEPPRHSSRWSDAKTLGGVPGQSDPVTYVAKAHFSAVADPG